MSEEAIYCRIHGAVAGMMKDPDPDKGALFNELYGVLNAVRVRIKFNQGIPAEFLPRIEEVLARAEEAGGAAGRAK